MSWGGFYFLEALIVDGGGGGGVGYIYILYSCL
jgi:hypothetical protein